MVNFRKVISYCVLAAFAGVMVSCSEDNAGTDGTSQARVRIEKVYPDEDMYTFTNFGDAAVDISGYRLCSRLVYTQDLSSLTLVEGSLNLAPGASVTLSGWPIDDNAADLGLYLSSGDFASADAMVDFMQYGDDDQGRESVAVQKGIWSAGDFVEGNPPFTYVGNGTQDGVNFWEASGDGEPNVRIVKVYPDEDKYSFKNFGNAAVDISNYRLCSKFAYTADLSGLTLEDGSLNLAPDQTVTLSGFAIDDAEADLGLYIAITNNAGFGVADNMVDFVQWGSAGNGRESVAVTKGIWTAGDFIDAAGPYEYTGDGGENGLDFWEGSGSVTMANVRIVKVYPDRDTYTFKNFGDAEADISNYRLCSKFDYTQNLTGLTIVEGQLVLAPDASVTLSGFVIDDTEADFGLYKAGSENADFAVADNMIDFVQWGSGGNGRESVAVDKGIWSAGDFIDQVGPFSYNGDGAENGVNFWSGFDPRPNIRFVRVDADINEIIIKNFDSETVDISNYRLCSKLVYTNNLTSLTLENGSLNLEAGNTVTLSLTGFDIDATGADLGLYIASGPFSDPNGLVDFMQYGSAGNGRESEAAEKGLWNEGEFVSNQGPFFYNGDGIERGADTWDPTPDNTPLVRIIAVDAGSDQLVVKNFGNTAIDISAYRFCSLFAYTAEAGITTDMNIESGNLNLGPGESVTLSGWPLDNVDADVGLYVAGNNTIFGDDANMVDFMQYGAAGNGREGVANTKGIWTAGEFIGGAGPFRYVGNGSQQGEDFWK